MRVIVRDDSTGKWRLFERPLELVVAREIGDVVPALEKIEVACASGVYAAGFIAYEAAPAFDAALRVQTDDAFPLLWFGLYERFHDLPDDVIQEPISGAAMPGAWKPSVDRLQYERAFDQIQELIRSGDTYQVNFTYRLTTPGPDSPFGFFQQLTAAQEANFGAYVHAGEWVICSASPELFFDKNGSTVRSKPMKGTAPRGLWFEQDVAHAEQLKASTKERAEHVMIVDMVRSDIGRVARPGTVQVSSLFDVERYPTIWQMTSTVVAETDASLTDVMKALFPPASITGAPKASTMAVIASVETTPRRVYTGTIGFVDPDGRAQFSVAIRTALINRKTGTVEYGVGGGIVADSVACQEYDESSLKADVLRARPVAFDLLETLLWTPEDGYTWLEGHLLRLMRSAEYFGFNLHHGDVRGRLHGLEEELRAAAHSRSHRVRLVASKKGAMSLVAAPYVEDGFGDLELAASPINPADRFLYHKTTNRATYERALKERPGAADVLLFNDQDLITESTIANVVVELDGTLCTPPVECGLLPGVARRALLEEGRVAERAVHRRELDRATRIFLINSVRGMHPVTVHEHPPRVTQSL